MKRRESPESRSPFVPERMVFVLSLFPFLLAVIFLTLLPTFRFPDPVVYGFVLVLLFCQFVAGFLFWRRHKSVLREHDRLSRQLEERIGYYQAVNDGIISGYLVFDLEHGIVIDANRNAEIMLGGPSQQILGQPITSFFPHEFTDMMLLQRRPYQTIRLKRTQVAGLDGREFPAQFSSEALRINHHALAVANLVDLTDQVQAERSLTLSRQRFQALYNNVPVGLFQSTPQGMFIEANQALCDLLGYPDIPTLLATRLEDFFVDPSARESLVDELDRDKVVVTRELQLRTYSGDPIWARVHVRRNIEPSTGLVFLDGALLDISDHKRLELEQQMVQNLRVRMKRIDAVADLAGNVAHEFNNLLFGLRLKIQAMSTVSGPDGHRRLMNLVNDTVDRAVEFTDGLLSVTGGSPMVSSVMSIQDIVEDAVAALRRHSPPFEFSEDFRDPPVQIVGDRDSLTMVVQELVHNAAEAISDGGTIRIVSDCRRPGEVMAGEMERWNELHGVLVIEDTGYGMNDEILDRIFDPFFTTHEFGGGRGLGLAKVYGVVKRHEGGLLYATKPQIGTEVTLFLPLAPKQPQS